MGHDLTRLAGGSISELADEVRTASAGSGSMERAARCLCRHLYERLATPEGERACVLVRCYTTLPFGGLPDDLQRFARRAHGTVAITPPEPGMRCLVLLATVGDEPAWNDRRSSVGHQAIPLPSPYVVERAPMIARLVRELGLDLTQVVRPAVAGGGLVGDPFLGVFHVAEAAGSPFIPAQDFVRRHAVRSVIGAGGVLPSGELFAVLLFTRASIPSPVADAFRAIADACHDALRTAAHSVLDDTAGA